MKNDWKRKLSSRKLWLAVAAVIGYLLAEGLTDSAAVDKKDAR